MFDGRGLTFCISWKKRLLYDVDFMAMQIEFVLVDLRRIELWVWKQRI